MSVKILLSVIIILSGIHGVEFKDPPESSSGTCIKVLELPGRDSVFLNPVNYCRDNNGNYYYASPLKTTVCNDTLCQIAFLKIYWDLAGHFTHFDTLPGKPLTKYDHKPFTSRDYLKLQETLRNENSILGEKNPDELVDKNKKRYSEKLDAITGATAREIQSAVVEGALYSTYSLWHLVNGNINQDLRKYTLSIYNAEIENQLLRAENPKTLLFGLKQLDGSYFENHFERIIDLMKSGHPLVNFYIAKKLNPDILLIEKNRNELIEIWDILDRNTQSVFSKYLHRE